MADRPKFRGVIRYWRPERAAGLADIDISSDAADTLGGLRQMKVSGSLNGTPFDSNTMPAGGGILALTVSRTMLDAAGVQVGDAVEVEVERIV